MDDEEDSFTPEALPAAKSKESNGIMDRVNTWLMEND